MSAVDRPAVSTTDQRGGKLNSDPAEDAIPVTASDTVKIFTDGSACRGLLVGTAGAADLLMSTGTLRSAVPLQAGYNPLRVIRVNSTSLTAANIWALV